MLALWSAMATHDDTTRVHGPRSRRASGAALAIVGVLAQGATAWAFTLQTPPVAPDPNAYVTCKMTASSRAPISAVASIMTDAGTDVTEFSNSLRVSPSATPDGRYYAEETAGSLNDGARYCRVVVTGARRKDVDVTLTAFDANDAPIATVQAR
jgi:hypothetical protein